MHQLADVSTSTIPFRSVARSTKVSPAQPPKVSDLLILIDGTSSMGTYIRSLNDSLPEIIRVSSLTGCFERIGLAVYRDYKRDPLSRVTEWSGWYGVNEDSVPQDGTDRPGLLKFAYKLFPYGGGDWPEATKTGLSFCEEKMSSTRGTVVMLYSDAPPHTIKTVGENWTAEQTALKNLSRAMFADWISAANTLRAKNAQVFSIIQAKQASTISLYAFLSAKTGGTCLNIAPLKSREISQLTIDTLLAWIGVEKLGTQIHPEKELQVDIADFRSDVNLDTIASEEDPACQGILALDLNEDFPEKLSRRRMLYAERMKLVSNLGRGEQTVNLSDRYKTDPKYRALVVDQLTGIIKNGVQVLAINPLFGSLWRAVCNDHENGARETLVKLFAQQVNKIKKAEDKARMKTWLEESYNHDAEILEILRAVPESEQFPGVYLDPVNNFGDGEDNKTLTRAELLEISRSCDPQILRRLGQILTRLTYVSRKQDLPAHIGSNSTIPIIPVALAKSRYKQKFWNIILHTVVRGTILASRPAALLAALSLRIGVAPLRDVADAELLHNSQWNNLHCPETWNVGCLSLLLDADKDFRERRRYRKEKKSRGCLEFLMNTGEDCESSKQSPQDKRSCLLDSQDRLLFQTLVDYKVLEANLNTTLQAKIGWDPKTTLTAIGPVVTCRRCLFPRSVTMMAKDFICGHCAYVSDGTLSQDELEKRTKTNVSQDVDESLKISWVECRLTDCRGQYVVYNPDKLGVTPKCWYCRAGNRILGAKHLAPPTAPLVECKQCTSRVIWPEEYRPTGFEAKDYSCPACLSGQQTITEVETNVESLIKDNGQLWLLQDEGKKVGRPFSGRSMFQIITTSGIEGFASDVQLFPPQAVDFKFVRGGKPVLNSTEIIANLRNLVRRRHMEFTSCSLCFRDFKHGQLRTACGRKKCHQRICSDCHKSWYGQNKPGSIINVAALCCPFCRRLPSASSVSEYKLNTAGDLHCAIDEAGTWTYAWCPDCGLAKRYRERQCQVAAPIDIGLWSCEGCPMRIVDASGAIIKIQDCPGCGISTEKIHGCDRIVCSLCNTIWCWACRKPQPESYLLGRRHMLQEHGSEDVDFFRELRDESEDDPTSDYPDSDYFA